MLARLVVPKAELLDVHAKVHRLSLSFVQPSPVTTALPSQWTAHVTMARRVIPAHGPRHARIVGKSTEIVGSVKRLRRWVGDKKQEFPIS